MGASRDESKRTRRVVGDSARAAAGPNAQRPAIAFRQKLRKGIAIALLSYAGWLTPAASAPPSSTQSAVLEYRVFIPVNLVAIDGNAVEVNRGTNLSPIRNRLDLAPGTHQLQLRAEVEEYPLQPDSIEFTAAAGKEYRVDFDSVDHKALEGGRTTLYFNFRSPIVRERRPGQGMAAKRIGIQIASSITMPLEPQADLRNGLLLFEDRTLPEEKTATIYCPRTGRLKVQNVFVQRISGRSGETQVEYRRGDQVQSIRLLPGEYRVDVTLEGGKWRIAQVQSGFRTLTLNAGAGRTYRINVAIESGGTQFSKDVVGNTQMQTAFGWDASFEDVTGQTLDDQ